MSVTLDQYIRDTIFKCKTNKITLLIFVVEFRDHNRDWENLYYTPRLKTNLEMIV